MKTKILVVLLLTATLLFSQARKIEFTEYDLDNGLHVILHQDDTTPIVAVSIHKSNPLNPVTTSVLGPVR